MTIWQSQFQVEKTASASYHIFAKMKRFRPQTTMTAVTVDEGIEGYRNEALEWRLKTANVLEIPHHIVSFKELYGFHS